MIGSHAPRPDSNGGRELNIQPLRMPDLPDAAGDYFRQDVASFVRTAGRMTTRLEAEVVDPLPEGVRWRGNTSAAPPKSTIMQLEAMKDKGYSIMYGRYDAAPAVEAPVMTNIGFFVDPEDSNALSGLLHPAESPESRAYGRLLRAITDSNLGYYHFVDGHNARNTLLRDVSSLPGDVVDTLTRRGFLTGQLYGGEEMQRRIEAYGDTDNITRTNLALYEHFREKGVAPLGMEELYGMAAKSVRLEIEANPDIAPPVGRQAQTGFEEF
jgi:hypothetical protein